ncbi:hypothetical protein E2C01_048542 [Portunus trituberculatus]|uniref:Secreted protein n=1 Tax=Portunus trituberculatus TaxID=210409 RepID=A0A5B7GBX5_PORTR|nr:hypothetical protein [Portunus trituberculatus]
MRAPRLSLAWYGVAGLCVRGLPGCGAPRTTTLIQAAVATRRHGARLHSRSARLAYTKRGGDTPPPSSSAICVSSERGLRDGARLWLVPHCTPISSSSSSSGDDHAMFPHEVALPCWPMTRLVGRISMHRARRQALGLGVEEDGSVPLQIFG